MSVLASKTTNRPKLSPRREMFVHRYLAHGNGVAAAREAGYSGTDNSLRVTASRLLTNANVRAEIVRHLQPHEDQLRELMQKAIARLDEIVSPGTEGVTRTQQIQAATLIAKLAGLLQPAQHLHMHGSVDAVGLDDLDAMEPDERAIETDRRLRVIVLAFGDELRKLLAVPRARLLDGIEEVEG